MRNYPNLAAEQAAARQDRKEATQPVLARGNQMALAFRDCRWYSHTRDLVQRVDERLRRTRVLG